MSVQKEGPLMSVQKGEHFSKIDYGHGRNTVSFTETLGGKYISINITGPKGGNQQATLVSRDDFFTAAKHVLDVTKRKREA